ncbi:MAG: glutamyl-tRNA reductase [Chloroflexi bacterium]|nr:glutamyl-tRNA reductase [Chloroflexota bacterium]
MTIFVAGLSYRTAPVEVREQIAVPPAKLRCCGCRLKISGGLSEVVLLSTCNRVEIYGVAPRVDGRINRLFQTLTTGATDFRPHLYVMEGDEALRHLFSVASGLDSMVLGETEITGQVKHAYQTAQEAGLTGRHLNRVFQTALQTAKRIRTGTQIGRGATSVGSVAVELAEKIFGPRLTGQTIMIIGAGKMGEACIRHLAKKGVRSVLVSNRSVERAQELAQEFGGRALRFEQFLEAMVETDIVVSSTGCPETILRRPDLEAVMRTRRQRPLFLIDIAVPRDIDPEAQSLENVYLYNIDHLEALVRENVRHREQELALCRAIVDEQTAAVMAKLNLIKEKAYDICLQPQPGWVFCGAVACGG